MSQTMKIQCHVASLSDETMTEIVLDYGDGMATISVPYITDLDDDLARADEVANRIVSSVNALAGIDDPAGFVKEAADIIRLFAHRDAGFPVNTIDLTRRTNDFLASLPEQPTPT